MWAFGCVVCVVIAGCASQQQYLYKPTQGPEKPLAPVSARVVSPAEAAASGLVATSISFPFAADADGTQLVQDLLAHADAARARYVTDLAIYLQSTQDGRAVECRSDIVPETVAETVQRPSRYETVSVNKPVTRMVTEYQYRCKPVSRLETRYRTEYQQQCGSVSRPVTRTRTVYRSQYDSYSKTTRSVPQTESYTAYESHYECKSVPVQRSYTESVMKSECGSEPVTHSVTRYEFQLESRFVPAHLETITRQRLRELEPACYVIGTDGAPATRSSNRVEAKIFIEPTR